MDKRKALLTLHDYHSYHSTSIQNGKCSNGHGQQAQLNVEPSKLPLFHGDKKQDQFTGDQWLERFEKCQSTGQWNAARSNSYFYKSLRGLALR